MNKNILITGASKGLGLQITNRLLSDGHNVFGISRTKGDLPILMEKYKDQLKYLSFDMLETSDIKTKVFKSWIGDIEIHGFVNNAAMAYDTLLTNIDIDKLNTMTTINQISPMVMTKYVIRNMLLHNIKGSIVHISSISVHTGYKGLSMYAATKGALEAFSKNAAREWGVKGIRSNSIACGFMETDMTSVMDDATKAKLYKRVALKQATDMDSVAASVAYLLSDDSKSMTGQVLHIDGGAI